MFIVRSARAAGRGSGPGSPAWVTTTPKLLEVPANARREEVLADPVLHRNDVRIFIVQKLVFPKKADFFVEVVIGPANQLPGETGVVVAGSAGEVEAGDRNVQIGDVRIIAAEAAAEIRLELAAAELKHEISEKGAAVQIGVGIEGEIHAIETGIEVGFNAIIEGVYFERRADRARAEDVPQLHAADETHVLVRIDGQLIAGDRDEATGAAEVLIRVDAQLEARIPAISKTGWRRRS